MKVFFTSFVLLFIPFIIFCQEKPPECQNDFANVLAADTIEVNVIQNDWCMQGHEMAINYVLQPAGGHTSFNDSVIRYESYYFFEGVDSVRYSVKDLTNGLVSENAYLVVNVDNPGKEFLEVNNIRAMVNSYGYMFCDITEYQPWFEVPKGSGISSMFSMALWLGGLDEQNNIHVAAERYRQNGVDYYAGPFADIFEPDQLLVWNKVWNFGRSEIEDHQQNWTNPGYIVPEKIQSWPAHGNVINGEAEQLAPFIDWNSNSVYQPEWGDMPAIRGDQNVFMIFNDANGPHEESGGRPIGVEVIGQTYAYDCAEDSLFNNTIFLHYDIINRSDTTYHDFYTGLMADFDLGYAWDDYVGSDTVNSAFYVYNGDEEDEITTIFGGHGYGLHPPALAIVLLNQPLSSFLVPAGYTGPTAFAYEDDEIYNCIQGRWNDGTPITYGGNGYGGSTPASCTFSGNPVTNEGWTEQTAGNDPDDRRGIGATGPFNLSPGDTVSLDLAFVWARDYEGNHIASVALLQERIQQVRWYYDNDSTPCGTPWSGLKELKLPENDVSVYPNPCNDFLTIKTGLTKDNHFSEYVIYNIAGKQMQSGNIDPPVNMINVGNLAPGIYMIRIQGFENMVNTRFIKL